MQMVVGDVATAVDVLVLGAGPAGYVGAIRPRSWGGVSPWWTKGRPRHLFASRLHPAEGAAGGLCSAPISRRVWAWMRWASAPGRSASIGMGLPPGSKSVVDELSEGVARLLEGNKGDEVACRGWFINSKEMRVEGEYGSHRFIFERCLLATGAKRRVLPALPQNGVTILSPEQALALPEFPASLTIFGAIEYIALELATLFARLGSAVTLLLPGEALLDGIDPAALRLVQAGLRGLGVQVVANARPNRAREGAVVYTVGDKAEEQTSPLPLVVSLGVQPLPAEELQLGQAGITYEQDSAPVVDSSGRTANERVYVAGDGRGGPALASVAIEQAKVAVEAMNGARVQYAPLATPLVALTAPEIASVGFAPLAAQVAGYRTVTGRFPLAANGRALTLGTNAGLALVTADADNETLLGVTLVGPRAGELIGQAALAIEMGATLTDLSEILTPTRR